MEVDAMDLLQWQASHFDMELARTEVGHAFWYYRHKLAEWTPPNDIKKQNQAFFSLIEDTKSFPCDNCADGGITWIHKNPFNPVKETISHYTWRYHNAVNAHKKQAEEPIERLEIYKPGNDLLATFGTMKTTEILEIVERETATA